ncbi:hypothetical protein UFOVP410_107 [uncultured Caudovirales phage]|uniref:Tail tube protein n=1 Tax=uncultured Caudovirales phage TaxID=2100421 RepID=A0A6J5M3T5_9CAUD|nr:hypothetical protein UFOVP410_107 [uncultured Caudovirales phage]
MNPFSNSIDGMNSLLNVSQGPAQPCYYVVNIVPRLNFFSFLDTSTPDKLPVPRSDISLTDVGPMVTINLLSMKRLSMLAQNVSLPGRTLSTTPHQIFGTKREMPYGVLYDTMTINFICTNWMVERAFFDLWHQFIIGPKSNYLNYYDNYVADIVITKTDNSVSVDSSISAGLSTFTLEEAYPKTILAQELSYSSTDEYLTLSVEFSYARFRNTLNYLDTSQVNSDFLELVPSVPPVSNLL